MVSRDPLSGDLTSNSSAGKDSHHTEPPPGIPTSTALPHVESVLNRSGVESLSASNQTTASLARRLLPTVAYRPLGEDVEIGVTTTSPQVSQSQVPVSMPPDSLHPAMALSSGVHGTHLTEPTHAGVSPSTFSQDLSDGIPTQRTPSTGGLRMPPETRVPAGAFEQFTYPWICSERLPLSIFLTAKVHQMAVTAVLSELNLSAGVRNVHGSFVHCTQVRGRGE
ncbi:unnamed protein product [Echinostoma caproni]|uniref:Uncharacterized protein n=1 Tax=Echinostoma caproni TaxID=27848 RepID=A0A3P8FG83_9TREM|nr:unnamed protein product [Echinostoma caproni]